MILADTSVWVDHLRRRNARLARELQDAQVMVHPFIIGELACGRLEPRRAILDLIAQLPCTVVATDQEVLSLIERRRLMGRGIGWVDAHLLASAILSPETTLWTLDARLSRVAGDMGVA